MTAPLSETPGLPVCPLCASPLETFVTTWHVPGTTGWGVKTEIVRLTAVTACTGCEYAREGK